MLDLVSSVVPNRSRDATLSPSARRAPWRWALIVLLLSIWSAPTVAEAGSKSSRRADRAATADRRETSQDSRENRSRVRCCGLLLSASFIGAGAGIVAPLSQRLHLEYMHGTQSLIFSSSSYDVLHARLFSGNSFNVFLGGGLRATRGHHGETSKKLGPALGIGNDWLFDSRVSLGVDWVAAEADIPILLRLKLGFFH